MSYECDDCGASFDTLSRLRLHDCTPDQPADETVSREDGSPEEAPFEDSGFDRQELERDYPKVVERRRENASRTTTKAIRNQRSFRVLSSDQP